jgi:hypothetical protein
MSTVASLSCISSRSLTTRVQVYDKKNGVAVKCSSRRATLMTVASSAPKGVTQPTSKPVVPPPKFGFVENAERLNSRAAMVSFREILHGKSL